MFPSLLLLPQGEETRERLTIQCTSEDSLIVPLTLALEEVISRTGPLSDCDYHPKIRLGRGV